MPKLAWMAALLASTIGGAGLAAEPGKVLTGAEAFGDWTHDAPGVARHITPDALPAPYQTRSAGNSPGVSRRPDDATPRVGDGYRVELFKSGLEGPRALAVAPNGDVFVALSQEGKVRVLRPGKSGGRAGSDSLFADDLDLPYGIAFYPPGPDPKWVYVGETDKVVRYPYAAGSMKPGGEGQTVVADLPSGGAHWTRDLAFSADGSRLFVAVGSASNVAQGMGGEPDGFRSSHALGAAWGDEAGRADVLAFDPEGKGGEAYATGIRNCAGLGLQPATGDLWCATNERDGLGDNLPPDYVTPVEAGAFYGWPWYYIGDHQDPRHQGARPDLAGKVTVPEVLIQPHSAPLGIAFAGPDDLGGKLTGDAFVTLHGSWNRGHRTGYKVVRVRIADGKPTGVYEDFMTGFVISDQKVWGRPVGIAFAKDGALLVSEDGSGTIWRVTAAE